MKSSRGRSCIASKICPTGLDRRALPVGGLDGEGLSGILTEQAGRLVLQTQPEPPSILQQENGQGNALRPLWASRVGCPETLARRLGRGAAATARPCRDGQLDLVEFAGPTPGFFERTGDEDWEPFKPFVSLPVLNWSDPNLKFVDLTGDGHADLLISEDAAFCCTPRSPKRASARRRGCSSPSTRKRDPSLSLPTVPSRPSSPTCRAMA